VDFDLGGLILLGLIPFLVILEFRDAQFRKSWLQDRERLRRNFSFFSASLLVMLLLPGMNEYVSRHTIRLFDWSRLSLLEGGACFLIAELLGWFLHYIKHRSQFLWYFHFQHHREEQYSVWLTTHTHALEVVISATIIATTICFLGFSKPVMESYLVFYSFAKVYQHSAHHYTLGLLDFLVISPDYHRLHHHRDSQWNYGISLTIFDVLFRTGKWPSPKRQDDELRFGLSGKDGYPFGFWEEMAYFVKGQRSSEARFRLQSSSARVA